MSFCYSIIWNVDVKICEFIDDPFPEHISRFHNSMHIYNTLKYYFIIATLLHSIFHVNSLREHYRQNTRWLRNYLHTVNQIKVRTRTSATIGLWWWWIDGFSHKSDQLNGDVCNGSGDQWKHPRYARASNLGSSVSRPTPYELDLSARFLPPSPWAMCSAAISYISNPCVKQCNKLNYKTPNKIWQWILNRWKCSIMLLLNMHNTV